MAESNMEGESELETKPYKDLPVISDQGVFQHDTGDTYDGFFEAKKKDRSVKMHGQNCYIRETFGKKEISLESNPVCVESTRILSAIKEWERNLKRYARGAYKNRPKYRRITIIQTLQSPGTYTTAEGDIYTGTWENDRLGSNEEVTITFTDGSRYEGHFKDWSYNGKGKYIYPDSSVLTGDFVDNIPVGQLTLTDPNGHQWLGKADHGFAWFDPVNHFYEMLERCRDLKRLRRSDIIARSTVSTIKTVQSVIKENVDKFDQVDT